MRERREAVTQAAFEVTLNKGRLASITVIEGRATNGSTDDEGQRAQLERCLERVRRLPEHLKFEPGITLIIGENGSGKSTLARALFMAMEYAAHVQDNGDPEAAHTLVFTKSGDPSATGLIPEIGKSITVDNLQNGLGLTSVNYYDAPALTGLHIDNVLEDPFFHDDHFRSHRQTVDFAFSQIREGKDRGEHPGVYIIDEPETGMSPRRHRGIAEELYGSTVDNSIIITPTNSVVLFESDLPRIDLDFPERGIHRPSEYPIDR